MQIYATTGVHGRMMRGGLGFLKDFTLMAYDCDHAPSRDGASSHLLVTRGLA